MPKLSIVRYVLGTCLVLALLMVPGGVSVAHAQPPDPCQLIPCTAVNPEANWCWCPEQQVLFDPGQVETNARIGFQVGIVNTLPVEVDLVDQSGALVAAVPPGVTGSLAVPGPGTYTYLLASPQLISPPTLTVIGQSG